MARTPSSLGDINLDAIQTLRKTYCSNVEAHRVIETGLEFNYIEYTYDDCGRKSTVKYYYDCAAEVSTISFVADSASNLNGKSFVIYGTRDAVQYRFIYCISCAATIPTCTSTIKYIRVGIQACDPAPVISLATKQAFEANTFAASEFSVCVINGSMTVTNNTKGEASNIADVGTGFTFATSTEGNRTLVETITYNYYTDGTKQLKSITTSSGEHLFDLGETQNNSTIIAGKDGQLLNIDKYNRAAVKLSDVDQQFLEKIYDQLRIMNMYLSEMTGAEFERGDLDG